MDDLQSDYRPTQIRPPVLDPVKTQVVQAPTPQLVAPVNRTDPGIAMKGQSPEPAGLAGPNGMAMLGQAFQARNAQNANYQFEQETKARQKFGSMAATLDPSDPEAYAKLGARAMQDPDIAAYGQESMKNLAQIHNTITNTAGMKLDQSDNIMKRFGKVLPQIAANPDDAGAYIDAAIKTIPEEGGLRDYARTYMHKSAALLTDGLPEDPTKRWAMVRQRFAAGLAATDNAQAIGGILGTTENREGVSGLVVPAGGMRGPNGEQLKAGTFVPSGTAASQMGQGQGGGEGTSSGTPGASPPAEGQPAPAPGPAPGPGPGKPAGRPPVAVGPGNIPEYTLKLGESADSITNPGQIKVNGVLGYGGVASDGKPMFTGQMPPKGPKPGQLTTDAGAPVPQLTPQQTQQDTILHQEYQNRLPMYDDAQKAHIQLGMMQQNLDEMAKGGFFTSTGWKGGDRVALGKALKFFSDMGLPVPNPDNHTMAEAEDFIKQATNFSASVAKSAVRGPEAFQTLDMLKGAAPGIDNTYLGNKQLIAGYQAIANRTMDERKFLEGWQNTHQGQLIGAMDEFNKQHPAQGVVDRAAQSFAIDPETGKYKSAASLKYAMEQGWITREKAKQLILEQKIAVPGQPKALQEPSTPPTPGGQ